MINPYSARSGRAAAIAVQRAVEDIVDESGLSVALVKLHGSHSAAGSCDCEACRTKRKGAGSMQQLAGVVLSREGHILIPGVVKPNVQSRIEVWIGDQEYTAKVQRFDQQMQLSILKIIPDAPLRPVDMKRLGDLSPGAQCVILEPSGESLGFGTFSTVDTCRGVIPGYYRQFVINNSGKDLHGSPVFDVKGDWVGFALSGARIQSILDLGVDLTALLEDALKGGTQSEDSSQVDGWLGMYSTPVNKEYARKMNFSKSSLWVTFVTGGGPSDKAGLKAGDIIVGLNGEPLQMSGSQLSRYFKQALHSKKGKPFSFTVLRDGEELVCSGTFGKNPDRTMLNANDIGLTVVDIHESDIISRKLFVEEGVRVVAVQRGGPAAVASSSSRNKLLNPGDVIVAVDGKPTPTLKAFARVLEEVRKEDPDVLLVQYARGRVTGYAGLNLRIGENGEGGDK